MRYLRNAPAELKAIISNAKSNTKESLKMKTKIRMKRIKDQRIGGFWERGDIKTYELAVDLINYHMKIMSEEKKETLEQNCLYDRDVQDVTQKRKHNL